MTNFVFQPNTESYESIRLHTYTDTSCKRTSDKHSYEGLFHQYKDGDPLPSGKSLRRIVELSREILFPGYFGNSTVHRRTINYHIGVNVEELFGLLTEQIQAGLCFGLENTPSDNVIKKFLTEIRLHP